MDYGEKQIMAYYFDQYMKNLIYDSEYAYSLLDNQYKEKRFESYENFEKFVNDNLDCFKRSVLLKYQIESFDKYKEYICHDNFDNYYIFKEIGPMNYTILLDQYTIEDEIFKTTYNKQRDDNNKAQLRLSLVNQMLNRKDYNALYNVLDKDFKEKVFNNQESFEKYVKENFFELNGFEYTNFSKEGNKYKIKTEISDLKNNTNDKKVKRFLVELSENDEFLISFDI